MAAWNEDQMRGAAARLYVPLRSWQTRLLRLHAGAGHDPLLADLVIAGLTQSEGAITSMSEEPTDYEAISYCWGAVKLSTPVLVNRMEYRVSPSLAGALRRFRSEDTVRYLWADALCINQYDNDEKSQQVSFIHSIFRKASSVLVWLGGAGMHTSDAIAALFLPTKTDRPPLTEDRRAGLQDLCFRPWARRVWVQQEVFFARELNIFCGPDVLSLADYSAASRELLELIRINPEISNASTERGLRDVEAKLLAVCNMSLASDVSLLQLDSERIEVALGNRSSEPDTVHRVRFAPETVLERCTRLQATDPRDYIYAFLGLTYCETPTLHRTRGLATRSSSSLVVQVDYNLSVSQVFQQITRFILNRDLGLRCFEEEKLSCTKSTSTELDLPSWTIDWTSDTSQVIRFTFQQPINLDIGRGNMDFVDATWETMPRFESQNHDLDGTIHLMGTILGSFVKIERAYDAETLAASTSVEMLSRVRPGYGVFSHCLAHAPLEERTYYHSDESSRYEWRETVFHPDDCIADGDVIAQVDGLQYSCICLRPCPQGGFTFVCICRDEGILNTLLAGSDSAKYQHYSMVVLPPESRQEFVVC